MEFFNYHGYNGRIIECDPTETVEVKDQFGETVMTFERENPPPPPDPEPEEPQHVPSSRRSAESALLTDFQKYQRGES